MNLSIIYSLIFSHTFHFIDKRHTVCFLMGIHSRKAYFYCHGSMLFYKVKLLSSLYISQNGLSTDIDVREFFIFFKKLLTKEFQCDIIVKQQRDGLSCFVTRTGVCAGVAELADARDLKSRVTKVTYRFEPGVRHSLLIN